MTTPETITATITIETPTFTASLAGSATTAYVDQGDADTLAAALAADESATAALITTVAGKQPLDSDLTAIALLATTSYGRSLLELADAAAGRTLLGLGTAALSASSAFQASDADLTAIAALTTTSFGRSVLELANAAAGRTLFGLGTAATAASTDFAAAGDYRPTWIAGYYYGHEGVTVQAAATNMVSGQLKAMPFWNPAAHGIDRITVDVHTGTVGATGYLYLCADSNGYPGTVLASGSITATASGAYESATVSATAPRGLLWLVGHGTGTTWGPRALTGQNPLLPSNTSSTANVPNCWQVASGAGTTLLTSFPAGAVLSTLGIRMLVRST